jgi:hypothetical protein
MIIPTLAIAIIISWRTRKLMSELCHNIAVTVWIMANSYWMISEFFEFDTKPLFDNYTYKHLAIIPFVTGIITLFYYYVIWKPQNKHKQETM